MNYFPLIIGALAFMMFNKGKGQAEHKSGSNDGLNLSGVMSLLTNPNAVSALTAISKLTDPNKSKDDNKSAVIFELLANPFVGEIIAKLMPTSPKSSDAPQNDDPAPENNENTSSDTTDGNAFTYAQSIGEQIASEKQATQTTDFIIDPNNSTEPLPVKENDTQDKMEFVTDIPSKEIADKIFRALK